MKITLIDGTYEGNKGNVAQNLLENLTEKGHYVQHLELAKMKIAYCQGCWSCWLATPGLCAHKDDTEILLRETIQAELVIHITETKLGTITSLTKKAFDKSIPLIHPHIIIKNGLSKHKDRYTKFPKWGIVIIEAFQNEKNLEKPETLIPPQITPLFEVRVTPENWESIITDLMIENTTGVN